MLVVEDFKDVKFYLNGSVCEQGFVEREVCRSIILILEAKQSGD